MVIFFEQGLERHGKKLVIYLRRRDMKPVNPKMVWNREPTIIAPCSSLIMCLNFCSLAKNVSKQYLQQFNKSKTQ